MTRLDHLPGAGEIRWDYFPCVLDFNVASDWITSLYDIDRPINTINAYARDLDEFLRYAVVLGNFDPLTATKLDVLGFLRYLDRAPNFRPDKIRLNAPLTHETKRRKLASITSFYDYMLWSGIRDNNPAVRSGATGRVSQRGGRALLNASKAMPWIPNEDQWLCLLDMVCKHSVRTRVMFSLQYDAAFRRSELVSIELDFIDFANRTIALPSYCAKNFRARDIHYSEATQTLLQRYLAVRRNLSRAPGRLFLSESNRNHSQPIGYAIWNKTIRRIALDAKLPQFRPHTLRHLALTDLARAGWEMRDIADYAGHADSRTTERWYIHRAKNELRNRFRTSGSSVLSRRAQSLQSLVVP